jgi:hypothetical protein
VSIKKSSGKLCPNESATTKIQRHLIINTNNGNTKTKRSEEKEEMKNKKNHLQIEQLSQRLMEPPILINTISR